MALATGTRLGPYEIAALIGKGGMGEVHRATDTNLGRQVAIKVLPDAFASDPERLARFEREARALAPLNHPNVAGIYGLERTPTGTALVIELVEGPTLAERISSGALPLDEALPIARQIADALEAAHGQGIVHRDLKPANVKLRPDGTVKVLDFGLAKAFRPDLAATGAQAYPLGDPAAGLSPDVSQSPTVTSPAMTQAGVVLGTAAYMSPEQARGNPVDKRADVWAFGVIVYEMLTGRQPFGRGDATETVAAVVTQHPQLTDVPVTVRRLLKHCLEKDPRKRLHDIADAWTLLDEESTSAAAVSGSSKAVMTLGRSVVVGARCAGRCILARATRPVAQPLESLPIDLDPGVGAGSLSGADVIPSPDGTRLVYVANSRLYMLRLDQTGSAPIELPGTAGATAPFFRPDGQRIAFFADGKLKSIAADGSGLTIITEAAPQFGGSWDTDGTIVASVSRVLSRMQEDGSARQALTQLDAQRKEAAHRWPQILPGGNAVLFTTNEINPFANFDNGSIEVLSLRDRTRKTLQPKATYGRYVSAADGTGYLLYVNGGDLFAVEFDVDRLVIDGTPVRVLENVAYGPNPDGTARFDVSRDGTLVYRTGRAGVVSTIASVDSKCVAEPLLAKPDVYGRPSISPSGRDLALEIFDEQRSSIWVRDLLRGHMLRVASGYVVPLWTPDGKHIVMGSQTGAGTWWTSTTDESPRPLIEGTSAQLPWSFTSSGSALAIQQFRGLNWDITIAAVSSDGKELKAGTPEPFLSSDADEVHPSFSHDDRWIAYASNRSGTGSLDVYVQPYPQGTPVKVSISGGSYPRWSRNSRELFFVGPDGRVMVASYSNIGDEFRVGTIRVWCNTPLIRPFGNAKPYDLSLDSRTVIGLMPPPPSRTPVMLIRNLVDELRRRVPRR
ncbi:MAG TPA: protein kinase [Vicinamibacterales bacterium]|nr:protein kinase [Vicinamibacterales bacterium]